MIQKSLQERLHTLGYCVLPRHHINSPGYEGVLVSMHQEPQGHEPETMLLRLHDWDGISSMTRLHALTTMRSHIVAPGLVWIRSRQEREVTFFTFGGTLEKEENPDETIFSLRSPTPILELRPDQETTANLLADETEALFARAEARQQLSSNQLLDLLTVAGPEATYIAVLNSLLAHDEETAVAYRHHHEFISILQEERNWYQQKGGKSYHFHDLYTLLQTIPES